MLQIGQPKPTVLSRQNCDHLMATSVKSGKPAAKREVEPKLENRRKFQSERMLWCARNPVNGAWNGAGQAVPAGRNSLAGLTLAASISGSARASGFLFDHPPKLPLPSNFMPDPSPPTEESAAAAPSEDTSEPATSPPAADQQPARRRRRVPTAESHGLS